MMIKTSLENTCLPVLAEIKTAGGFSQQQMNQLATAIRIRTGVIQSLDNKELPENADNLDPCTECKKLCDFVKIVVDRGATFPNLIRWIAELAY